jgi:hypothetical protein
MTSCDRLIEIVQHLTWESCERFEDGHIKMIDPQVEEYKPIDFYLRVGLYMNRPVQTIIAEGNFLCFRSGKKWETLTLKQIDPKIPMSSLYHEDQIVTQYGSIGTMAWPTQPVGIGQTWTQPQQIAGMGQFSGAPSMQGPKLVWDPARSSETQVRMQIAQLQAQAQMQQHLLSQKAYANIPITTCNTNPISNNTGSWNGYFNSLHNSLQNLFGSKQTP